MEMLDSMVFLFGVLPVTIGCVVLLFRKHKKKTSQPSKSQGSSQENKDQVV